MFETVNKPLARGHCDADGELIEADGALLELQLACGGTVPGPLAIPAMRDLVSKAKDYGFRIARQFRAFDGETAVSAWAELTPHYSVPQTRRDAVSETAQFAGVRIAILSYELAQPGKNDDNDFSVVGRSIDLVSAELTARLDADQRILSVEAEASDLALTIDAMRSAIGGHWSKFITLDDTISQTGHWRLADGSRCRVEGSKRLWMLHLEPNGLTSAQPSGFHLYLTSEEPAPTGADEQSPKASPLALVASDLSPVLRPSLDRIIANAETIRGKLAGPLADEYSAYAADIAAAGQHLLNLVDDLADLDAVNDIEFAVASETIDLAELGRRAASILRIRAHERGIVVVPPTAGERQPATGDFRRVLQILLNLVGNAIRYSPEESQIWIRTDGNESVASITVADQGSGLSSEDQARIFEKFERLGRAGDGGSGLGLYIARRLAEAMNGELTVESARGQGARFTLALPIR